MFDFNGDGFSDSFDTFMEMDLVNGDDDFREDDGFFEEEEDDGEDDDYDDNEDEEDLDRDFYEESDEMIPYKKDSDEVELNIDDFESKEVRELLLTIEKLEKEIDESLAKEDLKKKDNLNENLEDIYGMGDICQC